MRESLRSVLHAVLQTVLQKASCKNWHDNVAASMPRLPVLHFRRNVAMLHGDPFAKASLRPDSLRAARSNQWHVTVFEPFFP
jgi:hypothetical protein